MVLQRLDGRDENHGAGRDPGATAHDVDELLEAHVGSEAALGDDAVAQLEPETVGDDRVVAVCDVREWAAMDEGRLPLPGLHEVRLQRLLQQHGHRAGGADLLGGHGLALERPADGDRTEALAQVGEVVGDGDDRHHLGCGRDVEARLAWGAVRAPAEPDDDLAQGAVVHVEAAPPADRVRVEAERVAVHQMGVDHRREQVVRGADRVDVPGEVEVDPLHRDDLGAPASRAASLDPEDGAERGLAQAEQRALADPAEGLDERDRGGGLPLAGPGRGHRRDRDHLAVGSACRRSSADKLDLRGVVSVRLDLVGLEAETGGDVGDRNGAPCADDGHDGQAYSSSRRHDVACRCGGSSPVASSPRTTTEGGQDERGDDT